MSFELTSKGWDAFNRMSKIHNEEIARQEREHGEQNTEYGWSCIDDDDHIRSLDDEVDLLIYAYWDDVLYTLADWITNGGETLDDKCHYGYSLREIISRISERGLLRWVG